MACVSYSEQICWSLAFDIDLNSQSTYSDGFSIQQLMLPQVEDMHYL